MMQIYNIIITISKCTHYIIHRNLISAPWPTLLRTVKIVGHGVECRRGQRHTECNSFYSSPHCVYGTEITIAVLILTSNMLIAPRSWIAGDGTCGVALCVKIENYTGVTTPDSFVATVSHLATACMSGKFYWNAFMGNEEYLIRVKTEWLINRPSSRTGN